MNAGGGERQRGCVRSPSMRKIKASLDVAHGGLHILMQKGAPVPDCGIYYAALHRASATEEERREVIDHADGTSRSWIKGLVGMTRTAPIFQSRRRVFF